MMYSEELHLNRGTLSLRDPRRLDAALAVLHNLGLACMPMRQDILALRLSFVKTLIRLRESSHVTQRN